MATTALTMRRAQAVVILVLFGASTAACAEDRDALCGRECVAPLECLPVSVVDGSYACMDASEPTCSGWPVGQVVPFTTTTGTMDGITPFTGYSAARATARGPRRLVPSDPMTAITAPM